MKVGPRLVTGLVGVLMLCVFQNPIIYTVLKNSSEGANMQASIILDVLLETVRRLGHLPRRIQIQADNTRMPGQLAAIDCLVVSY